MPECIRIGSIRSDPVRQSAGRLGLLLLPLVLVLSPGLALAQGQPTLAPASQAEMNFYTRIAALNVCIARTAGIDFDKAVAVAGETIAQVIQGQHGGQIAQVGPKPLSIDELRKGSINSAVLGAVEVCPNEVPADVRKKVSDVLKQAGGAAPASKPAPAGKSAPAAKP
jgi:hypothetical protein